MDALSCLYPSYIFSLIMGFAPFRIKRRGSLVKIEYLRSYQIVSTLLYVVFICFLIGVSFDSVKYYLSQTPMQRFIGFLYVILVVGLDSVNVIFNKINTTSTITLWTKLYHIDCLIRKRGIKLSYKKLMYTSAMFSLMGASIHTGYMIFLVSIQEYRDPLFSGSVYFSLNFAVSGFICVSCSFHAFFLVIGHMFQKVLENMENDLLKNPISDVESKLKCISDTAILHQELCEVSRLASDVTSVQMLASFAVTFSLITLQIYSMVTAFNNHNIELNYIVSSVICVLILLEEKLNLGVVCHRCMGMIPKTKELLTTLLNLYINEFKITREINSFNLQILHDHFEITAGNFFAIDLPIFLTAGSAITTYILLFVQTDPFVDLYQSMKEIVGVL